MQHSIKELYITGITFYDNKVMYGKKNKFYRESYIRKKINKSTLTHNTKKELSFFIELYKNDKRIICDNMLDRIVKNNLKL